MSETFASLPLIFGLLAASLHVVSGPDHLAAVAPLALHVRFRTWMVGMSWGIGHLIGMLVIGTLFFYFKELIPVEFISAYSEKIVGIMLIVIGFWALFRIIKLHSEKEHTHYHAHDDQQGNVFLHKHDHLHVITRMHTHPHKKSESQTYYAALGIGILHGLAGVSHILGLLPTLAFKSNFDSLLYLVGFGVGTILSMVAFSIILGFLGNSEKYKNKKQILTVINATAGISAIFVGIFWIWNTW